MASMYCTHHPHGLRLLLSVIAVIILVITSIIDFELTLVLHNYNYHLTIVISETLLEDTAG